MNDFIARLNANKLKNFFTLSQVLVRIKIYCERRDI